MVNEVNEVNEVIIVSKQEIDTMVMDGITFITSRIKKNMGGTNNTDP